MSSAGAAEIVEQSRSAGTTLIQELLDGKSIDSDLLARVVSEEYGVPLFNLNNMAQEHFPVELVPQSLIRKHKALPVYRRGNRLFIAVSDPTNTSALAEFKFATGIATDSIVVEHKQLLETIDEVIAKQDEIFDGDISDFTSAEDYIPDLEVEEELEETDFTKLADDAPVVKFVNKVLFDAIKQGASDVHFEPYEREYRVRVRADGVLQEVVRPPKGLAPRLAARLKVMARLDISERRAPQDGRIQLKLSKNRSIDFRVSTLAHPIWRKNCFANSGPRLSSHGCGRIRV
jgi:type IV pilus assembly protein PilB